MAESCGDGPKLGRWKEGRGKGARGGREGEREGQEGRAKGGKGWKMGEGRNFENGVEKFGGGKFEKHQ